MTPKALCGFANKSCKEELEKAVVSVIGTPRILKLLENILTESTFVLYVTVKGIVVLTLGDMTSLIGSNSPEVL